MPASKRNTPRTGPPDPRSSAPQPTAPQPTARQPRDLRPTAARVRLSIAGLTAAAALGFWLGFTWPAAGQQGAPAEPVASLEMVGEAPDQVVTVTPEGTDDPGPVTVTPEGTDDPGPVTVTPEETDDSGPITVTPEPTEPAEGTISPTPTLSATPTPTPTIGMTCTPPPCPCGRYVGVCPNIVCEVCTPTPTRTHTPTPTRTATPSSGSLSNIATRGRVGTGANVLIGGFITRGAPVKVILRAIGPSMGQPPTNVPGTLPDPMLQLFSGQTVIAQNDNWQTGNCGAEAPVGLHPKDPREACLVITLQPGPFTAIVSGVGGSSGVGLVEVFHAGGAGELSNIATRGDVQTGANVMIGGLIIRDRPTKVILRAIGPSMGQPPTNVPGTLQDPMFQLFSGQTVIAQNDNWQTGNCGAEAPVGLHPKDPREACLVITLQPGPYTAIVSGVGGTTGIGLVEVFKLGP